MSKQPNILFLFSDEHSFRCMSHVGVEEGGEPVHTPGFDRLASQGTVFSNAYCQMPLCTPSRISMLTGREVRGSGAWSNDSVLRPELATIPKTLGQAGYATCLVGKMHLGGNQQLAGFGQRPYGDLGGNTGHQWEPIPTPATGMRGRTNTAVGETTIPESQLQENLVCQESLAWLREQSCRNPQQPWLLCASFSRPHFPLTAPRRYWHRWEGKVPEPKIGGTGDAYDHPMSVEMRKGFMVEQISSAEQMRARAGYFACVEFIDEIIGDFLVRLEAAGLLDNTVIVYSSDHGEMAGEHGVWWKNGWYEACTKIPIIISTPAQRAGLAPAGRCAELVGNVDLYPTFCALAGIEPPSELDGIDISPALNGNALPTDRTMHTDSLIARWGQGSEFRSIRWKRWKYVVFRGLEPLMFDVVADPDEQVNLLKHELTDDARQAREFLAQHARNSMDFAAAEHDRTVRDADLHVQYPCRIKQRQAGNYYHMPDQRLVYADQMLYQPDVAAATAAEVIGDLA